MVTFISIFLALVVGEQPVELAVTGDIAAVELRLDGQTVGQLRGEPWLRICDFGQELSPHELVAIGFDAAGREVSRSSQWINLPQPRSQAELIPEEETSASGAPGGAVPGSAVPGSRDGQRRMRLIWQSADGHAPASWLIRFDGTKLDVDDPELFELPPYDPSTVHLVQAELRFGPSSAYAERVVGGEVGDIVDTELTALVFDVPRGRPPSLEDMKGFLTKNGKALEVVAVERGGADIVLVQEATQPLWGALNRLRQQALHTRDRSFLSTQLTSGLHHDDRLRVVLPVAKRGAGAGIDQFPISLDFAAIEHGPTSTGVGRKLVAGARVEGVLATFPYPTEGPLSDEAPLRVSEAVAVAAQAASASRRARLVVLVKGTESDDVSELSPREVRRYLARLQVPLRVWTPEIPEASVGASENPWGEMLEIGTVQKLQRAVIDLRETLDRQVVVWVRGRHLPQDIHLTSAGAKRLADVMLQ